MTIYDMMFTDNLYWLVQRYGVAEEKAEECANAIWVSQKYKMGAVYSIQDFLEDVKIGGFNDYDGEGHWVDREGINLGGIICNYNWLVRNQPSNAKFIVWYNK